jgi:hypothetical protein
MATANFQHDQDAERLSIVIWLPRKPRVGNSPRSLVRHDGGDELLLDDPGEDAL